MLSYGQVMNGFTVMSILFAPVGEDVIIIGVRKTPHGTHEHVIARVDQETLEGPEPAREWWNGKYSTSDSAVPSPALLRRAMERAGWQTEQPERDAQ